MRTVEVADPDVDDAGRERRAAVARPLDALGQRAEGGVGQAHQLIQFPPSTLSVCAVT